MKLYHLFIICCSFHILSGCKGKSSHSNSFDDSDTPITLSLETIVKDKGEEFLSTITSDIEYLALETTDESLIANISRIARLKNGNYVIGSRQQLYLFSPTGKFIRQVSQNGNGPAEYTRLGILLPNLQTGGFHLLTNNKVLEFDSQGEYVNHFSTTDGLMDMAIGPEGDIILHKLSVPKGPNDTEPTWFLYRFDRQGNELQRYENITPRIGGEDIVTFTTPIRPLYRYKDKVRFNEFGNDTIFNITKEGLQPSIILDLGQMKMPASPKGTINERDAVLSQINELLYLMDMREDEQFLYMTLSWGFSMKSLFAVYNKETGKATSFGDGGFLTTDSGLTNDIDGGFPFFPFVIQPDGYRIQWKSAIAFKEDILEKDYEANKKQYGDKFEKLYQLAQSLDEDDNPVLMITK